MKLDTRDVTRGRGEGGLPVRGPRGAARAGGGRGIPPPPPPAPATTAAPTLPRPVPNTAFERCGPDLSALRRHSDQPGPAGARAGYLLAPCLEQAGRAGGGGGGGG